MTTTTTAPDATVLLARATAYIQLARALAYPTDALLADLRAGGFVERLGAAVAVLDAAGPLAAALDDLARAVAALPAGPLGLAEEHTRLFARQVPAPPYESSYDRDPGNSRVVRLQEIARYYAAFGLRVAPDHPDLPDHLGAELEFAGVLCAKEAYAIDAGLAEPAAVCAEARARFVGEHLIGWLPRFVERLEAQARLAFYPAVAALALALLRDEPVAGLVAAPAPAVPAAADDEPFNCALGPGMAAALE
jgi:DMSO reductase family type II enzyme chaperone